MTDKGFTVIETLVGLGIIVLAITIVTLSFSKVNENIALDESAETAISVLNEARSLTLSAKEDSQYGVNVQSSGLVLFKGASYSSSDPSNVSTLLNALVGIRNINIVGGTGSIIFKRLTGATTNTGTFELYLLSTTTVYRTITVTATGVAEEN